MKISRYRVLVDRLWPRGIKKEHLGIDEWPKEIAPSTKLRKSFDHQPEKWLKFYADYCEELFEEKSYTTLVKLAKKAKNHNLTLIFGAKDKQYNHAQILKDVLENDI